LNKQRIGQAAFAVLLVPRLVLCDSTNGLYDFGDFAVKVPTATTCEAGCADGWLCNDSNATTAQRLNLCEAGTWVPVGKICGSDGQVIYNNGGVCGGDADLVWDDSTGKLTVIESVFVTAGGEAYSDIRPGQIEMEGTGAGIAGVQFTVDTDGSLLIEADEPLSNIYPTPGPGGGVLVEDNAGDGYIYARGYIKSGKQLYVGEAGQDGQIVIYNELGATDRTNTINPSASQTMDIVYTLPVDDGAANEFLQTNGSGALDWTPQVDILTGNSDNATVAAASTVYGPASGSLVWAADASAGTRSIVPRAGTVTKLYCIASAAPGALKTNVYTVTLGGADQAVTCSMVNPATTCNDTAHSFAFVAGNEIGYKLVTQPSATAAKHSCSIEVTY